MSSIFEALTGQSADDLRWRWYRNVNWTWVICVGLVCLTLLVAWIMWLWLGAPHYMAEVA